MQIPPITPDQLYSILYAMAVAILIFIGFLAVVLAVICLMGILEFLFPRWYFYIREGWKFRDQKYHILSGSYTFYRRLVALLKALSTGGVLWVGYLIFQELTVTF